MRCVILCVGRLKAGPEREIEARYLERARALGRGLGLSPIEIVELAESPARRPEDRMAEEAERLFAALPAGAALIVLDERGKSWPSGEFAGFLAKERDLGRGSLVFVLGGPDGLGEVVRKRADRLLGFGAATWPHQLVRLMLAEQIYRATTILAGHPYHRA